MSSLSVFITARDGGARLSAQPAAALRPAEPGDDKLPSVMLDERVAYQEMEGIGGAFTEAAAVTLAKLPLAKQEEVMRAYFDPKAGHGYTLCRTHIGSCDFALGNYSYCDEPGDHALKTFSIERDRQALLPMIRRAQAVSGNAFKLLASPWSPPAWMKTTGRMNLGGKLLPECREAWALYYARYIRAYAGEGVPIWALTVQNEPEAKQTWDSCIYTGEEERDFVRDHLGPTLHREGLADVKIVVWDHNRDRLYERARIVYDDPAAARYVWGAGFHWYVTDTFDNVQRVHDAWPDKKLLFTEGCQEGGPHDGSWLTGERYARSMIADFNRWTVGWIDWNMVLDETGGPNHVNNFCSAPILADTRTGEVRYQSSYYYIGHFSRFVRSGARRILSASTKDELEVVAFKNPDGSLAVVVMNRSETPVVFLLKTGAGTAPLTAPRRSIQTVVIAAGA
ncbi:MAG: glycoside hydrolase family 30 protein [Opitutaceae bacterium]|jgi:glucosylceramidase